MAASQTQRAQNSSSGGGFGAVIGLLVLIGLAVKFWYISVAVLVGTGVLIAIARAKERKKLRHRAGRWDAWLNEVNVVVADIGLREYARNQRVALGGVPVLCDIVLRNRRLEITISLLADERSTHDAEMGLRASSNVRDALGRGRTALVTRDRVVFLASDRGHVVDEFLLDEVVRLVDRVAVGPPRGIFTAAIPRPIPAAAGSQQDALDQLRKLGALHKAGILSDAEFTEKKASLLKQI